MTIKIRELIALDWSMESDFGIGLRLENQMRESIDHWSTTSFFKHEVLEDSDTKGLVRHDEVGCARFPGCAVARDFTETKVLNWHGLNVLLLDLGEQLVLVGWLGEMNSHGDDVEARADDAVFVRDSETSTVNDLAENDIAQAVAGCIIWLSRRE
ncbi:hypothetical protein HG530_008524 [Fusarium avenaceum]|nr:hypothetical protein HG530_008524 [Fusarium avenaceum]